MRSIPTVLTGVLAATSLAVAGCSSGSSPSRSSASSAGGSPAGSSTSTSSTGGSGGSGTCSLLTAAQASAINNVTYEAGTPLEVFAGTKDCFYKNTGKNLDTADVKDLTVVVDARPSCVATVKSAVSYGKPVTGLGKVAGGNSFGLKVEVSDHLCVRIWSASKAEQQGDFSHDVQIAKIVLAGLH